MEYASVAPLKGLEVHHTFTPSTAQLTLLAASKLSQPDLQDRSRDAFWQ
jgi:hypothetical protein